MSGIQKHTEDPISTAKATAVTPQTVYTPNSSSPSNPATSTPSSSYGYPPAQPGAAAPTPTQTVAGSFSNGPPPPQPGAFPTPQPPTVTAKPSLPPPPKAGEKAHPPEYYAPVQATPTQIAPPQPYPPQMSQPPPGPSFQGIPPSSTTSTNQSPSFSVSAPPTVRPTPTNPTDRVSLEHPPGYVQNPYASEMTAEQRFTVQQREQTSQSGAYPGLGYTEDRGTSNAGFDDNGSVWDSAKRWAKDVGEQASDMHGRIWEGINGGR